MEMPGAVECDPMGARAAGYLASRLHWHYGPGRYDELVTAAA
jgi:hypothetical protein